MKIYVKIWTFVPFKAQMISQGEKNDCKRNRRISMG